jgi:hypothetical protein
MKKFAFFLIALSFTATYGQKKKTTTKAPENKAQVLVKNGVASVEMNKAKVVLIVAKDTMLLADNKTASPVNCKVVPVKVKSNTFYCVTWNETSKTSTKLKKEESAITESQLWNPVTKTLLLGNTQKINKIEEIVFLDRLKTASETQYKTRNEGYLFSLLPNGDFTLSNKSATTKYAYNEKSMRYEPVKKK